MLFNSFEYIFVFLPIALIGYYVLCHYMKNEIALAFLLFVSLAFYGYWNPVYLLLFGFSILVNYFLGQRISHSVYPKAWLVAGIILNLTLLGYYKYFNFVVDNIEAVSGVNWNVENIILPLAISFYTFQQVSYLVDAYRGEVKDFNFTHYALFVTFFPQLIAGPIVHHKEMLPQFFDARNLSPKVINFALGISIFALGLFKKAVIADSLSQYVGPVFDGNDKVDFVQAWVSTLAYTFQLYFDFSGYSDMAVGSALLFGIRLPVNFFSPYKSASIIEFWRRWHITLSRFLRDYLYFALGGNRFGKLSRYRNLFLTMLIGGIWHGAGWTFMIWGALHGFYLIVNHGWRWLLERAGCRIDSLAYTIFAWSLTFLSVVFSWVYFRAPSVTRANEIIAGMLGFHGATLPSGVAFRLGDYIEVFELLGFQVGQGSGKALMGGAITILLALLISLFLPNSAQIFQRYDSVLFEKKNAFPMTNRGCNALWSTNVVSCLIVSFILAAGVLTLGQISEFLYFQF